jgi:hypothetical protein
VVVVSTDALGNVLWDKVLGAPTAVAADCVATSGSGCVVLASNGEGEENARLLWKIDGKGAIEWTKQFPVNRAYAGGSLIPVGDKAWLISGSAVPPGGDYSRAKVTKVDEFGSVLWEYVHEEDGKTGTSFAWQSAIGADSILVVGSVDEDDFAKRRNVLIISLSPNGELRWSASLGGKGLDVGWDVVANDDGSFALLGTTTTARNLEGDDPFLFVAKLVLR